MAKSDKHISEEDFRRYLRNRMTPEERHAFERELQKHPFEAEALEGMQQVSANRFDKDLRELKKHFAGGRPHSTTIYWVAAACLLILAISGVLWYQLDQDSTGRQVAEKQAVEKDITGEKTPEKPVQEMVLQDTLTQKIQTQDHQQESAVQDEENGIADRAEEKGKAPTENQSSEDLMDMQQSGLETGIIPEPSEPEKVLPAKESSIPPVEMIAEEKIVPEDPQSGQVAIENFSAPELTVDGIENRSASANKIIDAPTMKAQPLEGWEKFAQYLDSAAVLPPSYALEEKAVLMLIEVDSEGSILNMHNLHPENEDLFEKAREILVDGPKWQPGLNNGLPVPSQVEITITFKKRK